MLAVLRARHSSLQIHHRIASSVEDDRIMPSQSDAKLERDLHETIGALEILDTLREEFAQWLEEAQDDSKHETLENVLAHIETMEEEYKGRRDELKRQLKTA